MNKNKIVGYWLLIGVGMLIIQVLLGGITRLTGSGLSITEWKPILGTIPPLNDAEWQHAFMLYQEKTGQYKYLNQDFTISHFKFIYFWEWMHRNWARLISIVFLIPFIYFIIKKYFNVKMISNLVALFLLGAAQGLIGWIMVKSGLNDDNLYVSHIKLAIHFISALVLICFTCWFALTLLVENQAKVYHPGLKKYILWILLLLGIQLTYGAFMAGLKAANVAPTWPSINGAYIPDTVLNGDYIFNTINIHFIHRMLAYILFIGILIWQIKVQPIRESLLFHRIKSLPLVLVTIQVLLGIFTLLTSSVQVRNGFGLFEYLAQAHQLVAMFLLMSLITLLYILGANSRDSIKP
jgi:cytochrome c oxidase assembly protein subunit 15